MFSGLLYCFINSKVHVRGLSYHVLACELLSPCLQLPTLLIFVGHCLESIIALVTRIISIYLLCLLFFTALVVYCHFSIQPFPPLIWISSHTVSTGLGKLLYWTSFSVTMLVVGHLQGWFPLKGLLWNLLTVPYIFTGPPTTFDDTSSRAHCIIIAGSYQVAGKSC